MFYGVEILFIFLFTFLFIFLDAAFLRDFSDGFGLDDENLIEIVCTRSNAELSVSNFQIKISSFLSSVSEVS
jgi:hypothetical protein